VTFNPSFIQREKERILATRRPDIMQRAVASS